MQYNSEVYTHQGAKKNAKDIENKRYVFSIIDARLILCFICAVFTSRVLMLNGTAPFGIAFFMAIIYKKEIVEKLIITIGSILGYLSLCSEMKSFYIYIIIVLNITFLSFFINKISYKKQTIIYLTIVFLELTLFKTFSESLSLMVSSISAIIQLLCIIPAYYVIDYSLCCYNSINTRHLFNSEEIISMAITLALVIAGFRGLILFGISIRNIIALLSVILIGYVGGTAVGAASGIAAGIIIGMSTESMYAYTSIFGVCGFVSGIFKSSTKWISGIAATIIFLIFIFYEKGVQTFNLYEELISCVLFFIIPTDLLNKIELELNFESKQHIITEEYIRKIKGLLVKRLESFSDVLYSMSDILTNLSDNEKLALKSKSSALIENLADRVCNNCNMKTICWKRELYYTYASFEELISNYQDGNNIIPEEIERKCIKRSALIKNAEEIVNNYIINEMWRIRLSEGRGVLANQIDNMGASIKEIQKEFSSNFNFNNSTEKSIINAFNRLEINVLDIMCTNDKNDRLIINISMNACSGDQLCIKKILPIINEVTERYMSISNEGCKIDPNTNICDITFEETPKYYVESFVSRKSKFGEQENGDNYSFGKVKDGSYVVIISDGMGTGSEAQHESKAAIELIEKFTASGLSKITAINCVNSIMTFKFAEDEKFSTVDLCSIDLYNGKAQFMKVGAVASFIKRKNKVEIVNAKTLPIGVMDKADIDIKDKKIQNGDIILMLSDGIVDYDKENAGKLNWIVDYLENCDVKNSKEIADGLVEEAIKLSGGKAKDDMTAIASKIYCLH